MRARGSDELSLEFSRSDELSQIFVEMTSFHAFPSNSQTFFVPKRSNEVMKVGTTRSTAVQLQLSYGEAAVYPRHGQVHWESISSVDDLKS
jgi:hypothetical protein